MYINRNSIYYLIYRLYFNVYYIIRIKLNQTRITTTSRLTHYTL